MLGLSDHYLFLFRGSLPSLVPFLNSLWGLIIEVYPSLRLQPNIACFWKLKMEWFVSYASISSFPMVWFSRIIHVLMVVAICDFTPHSEIILFLNLLQFSTLIFDDLYGFGGFKLLLSEWCVHLCTSFICPRRELIAGYICRWCAPRLLTGFHCCTFTNHLLVPDTIYFVHFLGGQRG